MGDKIIFYGKGGNIYYQELIGQNIKIKQSKMVRLFNYSPRWCGNMQSFKYARSLVRLDAYSRGGVFFSEAKATGGLETEEVGELDARTLRARETVEKDL